MRTFAKVVRGSADQEIYELDTSQPIRIGRGNGCQIRLSDPLSSRTHVILAFENGDWKASDANSRNGTTVNDKRITSVKLRHGDRIKIGSTELQIEWSSTPEDDATTQELLLEAPITSEASGVHSLGELYSHQRSRDMLDLYQLSICLMRCTSPDEVAERGLEMLRIRTESTAVGFMWMDESRRLRPQKILPGELSNRLRLSSRLTERVVQDRQAVWIKDKLPSANTSYADAICVPLMDDSEVLGAIHLYREEEHFEQPHFDIAISASALLAAALVNTRNRAKLTAEKNRLTQRSADVSQLLGRCPAILKLKERIGRVAGVSGCVLVRGESGVGKELVARGLHENSPRRDRPLLCVNCAAIPGELMESQLFGHKRGAFTGADRDHAGMFQQAHTGTLFLDEVGELSLEGQAKLLRILEGHPFLPVGGTKEVTTDVRVIAATNRDLREYVQQKRFREDLYYRLSVFELHVPPLRERGSDIRLLLNHFLHHFRQQHGRPGLSLSPAALERLESYHWPGNIRQLRNVIDSAVVLAAGQQIETDDLSLRDVGSQTMESLRLEFWEEKLIKEALNRTKNNVVESAKLLGVSRATLYRKLDQYSIER